MNVIKQIIGLLMVAMAITMACYFLPFLNGLFDNYIVGFYVVAIVFPIGLSMYKAHMDSIKKLPPDVRMEREEECLKRWKETEEATFSLSEPLDLRNMTNIKD